tara:strand:+ start:2928 stop:3140 length:213 start_codon:yes stop_codon:yes gene_type:complete
VGSQSASANTKVLALLRFAGPIGNRKKLLAKPDEKAFSSAQKRRGRVTQYFQDRVVENIDVKVTDSPQLS